ncbi:MAG TPA: TIGR01777 family oxidoreductase [Pyrinomonadaceae bacterium]|nr:TIGR01777 family oxidoreductase [Pyrinomonadaceae bacterium]
MSEALVSKGRVVLAGGSGFLGRALAEAFARAGYEPVVLTREVKRTRSRVRQVRWDGRTPGAWARELEGAAAVVNLAGRSVDCRHTPQHRREIVESRVNSVEAIGRAIRSCAEPPAVWVQAASLAVYGDAGRRVCGEGAPTGRGFPVEVCRRWEQAFDSLQLSRTRKVLLRIGFVLGRDGGALPTLARLARLYLGGAIGEGHQYISWLHIRDFCRLALWCVENASAEGVYNATEPCPVTNAEFMCELRCALKRPWSPRVPAWLVCLGAFFLRTEPALVLEGRRCIPERLVEEHFKFIYTNLESALADLFMERKGQGVDVEVGRRRELERGGVVAHARTAPVGRG